LFSVVVIKIVVSPFGVLSVRMDTTLLIGMLSVKGVSLFAPMRRTPSSKTTHLLFHNPLLPPFTSSHPSSRLLLCLKKSWYPLRVFGVTWLDDILRVRGSPPIIDLY
jgi:hypothetical protein